MLHEEDVIYYREITKELAGKLQTALTAPGLIKIGNIVFNPAHVLVDFGARDVQGKPCVKIYQDGEGVAFRLYGEDVEALKWWMQSNSTGVLSEYRVAMQRQAEGEAQEKRFAQTVEALLELNVPGATLWMAEKFAQTILHYGGTLQEFEPFVLDWLKSTT